MAKKTVKRSKSRRRTRRRVPRRVKGGADSFPIQVPADAHQTPESSDNILGYHGK